MRVAIISEGRSDAAVITNILKGKLGIERSDVQYLVPELDYDETSLSQMRLEQFSNWTIVKQNCIDRRKITDFLDFFDNDRFVIIHIDSDVRNEIGYEVTDPMNVKTDADVELLRQNIKSKISDWLDSQHLDRIAFAVAIQEIDAWVLTLYEENTDFLHNVKERLFKQVNLKASKKDRKLVFSLENDKLKQYLLISHDFRKPKNLVALSKKNISLRLFLEELEAFQAK